MTSGPTRHDRDLFLPDRYENLAERALHKLPSIVAPVQASLRDLDARFADLAGAGRGGMMILRGSSGSGKTTFLETVGQFREGIEVLSVPFSGSIRKTLESLPESRRRIVIVEGREALGEVSQEEIEEALHSVNAFVRSRCGEGTLVVWPVNREELAHILRERADTLGGNALLGSGEQVTSFNGPDKSQFLSIVQNTLATLNNGASLLELGVSEETASDLATRTNTIGDYLGELRGLLIQNGAAVQELVASERCRVWTVVVAGNDPSGSVAALSRGGLGFADIDRLLTATNANIVAELKKHPEQLGILGTVLDARILHLDMVTALAVAREHGDEQLHALMRSEGMDTSSKSNALQRIKDSDLGLLLSGETLGTSKPGSKPGSNTKASFEALSRIASKNDVAINRAIGAALVSAGLIEGFEVEKDLGTGLSRKSDIYCVVSGEPIRLEMMWRKAHRRAEIANYVLTKLGNYGKAIKLLQ